PQKDAPLKLNESGSWIREDVSYEVNEPDAYALEEALRQKEKNGGEVVVLTAGPARAQQVLREALAKGADRAIHLEGDEFVRLDPASTAKAIAAAVNGENFDLIFTGLQSDDYGYAQTGVLLAGVLGAPFHHHLAHCKRGRWAQIKARTGVRILSRFGNAPADRADHSIRRKQASLRHFDGNQAGKKQAHDEIRVGGCRCCRREKRIEN